MADRYNLIRTPKLAIGRGSAGDIADLLKDRGGRILVITGSASYRKNREILNAIDKLPERNFMLSFERIGKEPSPSDIDSITRKYNANQIDAVLAIGGGSVLDAGKAVSAMLTMEGSVADYLEGVGRRKPGGSKKFFIAVPTTAGTGSETTSNAVISETGPGGFKKSLRHENFVPDIAVVDPLLALECPPDITASTGLDAFTQLVESYVSLKSNRLTNTLALEGIVNVRDWLEKAYSDGSNLEARSGMAYAASLSGITLANAGLGLVHGFASAIGGYFYAPHGVICGTLMGVVNRYNVVKLIGNKEITEAHQKYANLGKLFSGNANASMQWYMEYAAGYIEELIDKLNIRRLGDFGIGENDLEKIISATDHKANPVNFSNEELTGMLKSRL